MVHSELSKKHINKITNAGGVLLPDASLNKDGSLTVPNSASMHPIVPIGENIALAGTLAQLHDSSSDGDF